MTINFPIVAALALALIAAAGSGRADNGGSRESASAPVSATAVSAGLGQSCALTRGGGVTCWGANGHDELGDGTARDSRRPVDVSGLRSGVRAIAAGVRHTCALTSVGGVKCWGNSSPGTLGDGTATRRFTPVDVSGLNSGVTAIAAGLDHSCALTSAGSVKCWGYNRWGALGDGTTTNRWTPVDVVGLSSGVRAIAAGGFESCALTTTGGVKCWGGVGGDRLRPVDIAGVSSGVTAIATGGGHSCALTSAGGVRCWGSNDSGQLGDGTTSSRSTAGDVSGLSSGVTAIAAGASRSCALTGTGRVKCWGLNDFGQLGDGTTTSRSTPVDVVRLSRGVKAIAAGSFHSCALTSVGGVKCWGLNGSGQLGDRTTVNRLAPVRVIGFRAAKATLAIVSRSVAVTAARVASIRVRCGSEARCQGAVAVSASVAGKLAGSSARTVRVQLGSGALSVAAGRTMAVKVKLNARGFKLLVRAKRLSARLRISSRQPGGGTSAATGAVTLTAPTAG